MPGSKQTTTEPTTARPPRPLPAWTPAWEEESVRSPRLLLLSMTWEALNRNPAVSTARWERMDACIVDDLYAVVDYAVLFALSAAGIPDSWEAQFQKALDRHEGLCPTPSGESVTDLA